MDSGEEVSTKPIWGAGEGAEEEEGDVGSA